MKGNQMILTPNPISSKSFRFKGNTFSAEASDFGRNFNLGRVYDDACDEGFSIVSEKTGKIAVFSLYNHEEDSEGDLLMWVFKCVTPGLTHLKAVIFND
jgi:hypothetical protein